MRGGLTVRIAIASALLALVMGGGFAVLLSSVVQLRDAQQRAGQSREVLVVANLLERLIVDLETGVRVLVITGREDFLQPWQSAQAALPEQASRPERLVAGNPE